MSYPLTSSGAEFPPNLAAIFERVAARGNDELLWAPSGASSANDVLNCATDFINLFRAAGVGSGSFCAFSGDYSVQTLSIFLALASLGAVAVPFSAGAANEQLMLANEVGVEYWIDPAAGEIKRLPPGLRQQHILVNSLVEQGHPGLVIFTSGSTGKPKAILHDIERVASKFIEGRPGWRMAMMLLMDHFGGFNTLLSLLSYGGVAVCPAGRAPRAVCEAIQFGQVELLPTTPTFLGVLIASGLWKEYDLSSIRFVTYGAEPMPQATLRRIREILPGAEFKQTYGLSELGVLRSSSPEPDSLWLKVGGDGFETRVVDGQLHVRSASSMLGYLNAPSPIDENGWMNTGDLVEEREGLIRFLGRTNEIINVGGQKVLPHEIENVLLEAEGVVDAVVKGVSHPILGQAVVAQIATDRAEDFAAMAERLRNHCRARLQKYKVPMRFEMVDANSMMTPRAKKSRG